MKFLIGLLAAVVVLLASPAFADDDGWYAVNNRSGVCEKNNPSEMIEMARTAGKEYSMDDQRDGDDRVLQTTLTVPGGTITFYRGFDRCAAAIAKLGTAEKQELNRYQ